jgi:hypothetical protein
MGKAAEADVAYIDAGETLRQAGHLMRELGVGALVVRGENGKVQGTISRDMVVRRIAAGSDPKTVTVGEVASRHWPALLAPGHARQLWPGPGGSGHATGGTVPTASGASRTDPLAAYVGHTCPARAFRHSLRRMSDQVLSH